MSSSRRQRRGSHPRHEDRSHSIEDFYFEDPEPGRGAGMEAKTLRMCRQVQRRLETTLGGELDDPILQGLWVSAVVPEPGGTALLVEVVAPDPGRIDEIFARLSAARGWLRSEVASVLQRKRTPYLHFVVVPFREEDEP